MATLNIEELDDQLQFDGTPSFTGGMVSNERANMLAEEQSSLLVNCDISRFGKIATRRGTDALGGLIDQATVIQGLINYQTPADNYLVAMNNGKLFKYTGSWTQLGAFSSGNTTSPFAYAMGVDKLYFSDNTGSNHFRSWDGTNINDLDGSNGNTDPPRGIRLLTWFAGRIVAVSNDATFKDDQIFFSNFLEAEAGKWNRITQSFRVGDGEGDPITGLTGWLDFNLIVFKRHSIWLVNCNPKGVFTGEIDLLVANYEVKPVHRKIGCLAPLTAVQVGSDVWFLANDGVRSIKRTIASENQQEASETISFPIQDIIDRINKSFISTSCATFRDNRYILSVPLDSATSPNYTLVFNVLLNCWSGYWTGWTPTCFALRVPDASPARMVFGDSAGLVSEWLDYVPLSSEVTSSFQDRAATEIATLILTRGYTIRDLFSPKTGFRSEVEFSDSLANAFWAYRKDGAGSSTDFDSQSFSTAVGAPLTLPFFLPATLTPVGIRKVAVDLMQLEQWRELQLEIRTTSGKLSMRNMGLTAFLDSYLSRPDVEVAGPIGPEPSVSTSTT